MFRFSLSLPNELRVRLVLAIVLLITLGGCISGQARAKHSSTKNGSKSENSNRALSDANTGPVRVAAPAVDYRLSPEQILQRLDKAEAECSDKLEAVARLVDSERIFANTVEGIEQAIAAYLDVARRMEFLGGVHPEESVRRAAAIAEERSAKFMVRLLSRRDLYNALQGWLAYGQDRETLDDEQKQLILSLKREFERSGLALAEPKLQRLIAIRTKLAEIETRFIQNLDKNSDIVILKESELAGLPESFVKTLKLAEGGKNRVLPVRVTEFQIFMRNAENEAARKRVLVAFEGREAIRNISLLKEAIALRDEEAKLLGHKTYADYIASVQMAGSQKAVSSFLSSLREKLAPKRDENYAKILNLKREMTGNRKAVLGPWDLEYYFNEMRKREFSVDEEKLREYFPAPTVLGGIFRFCETVFGIDIREVANADVWASDVKLYEVRDSEDGTYLGAFYLDILPRKGKRSSAYYLISSGRKIGDRYRAPLSALVADFALQSDGSPPLLSHGEVKRLLFYFGNLMHGTLTAARYGSQSAISMNHDFTQVPTQVLENWAYEKDMLDMISGHYLDTARRLPEDIATKIKKSQNFDAGYKYSRQVFFAYFDQALHSTGRRVDPDEIYRKLYLDIMGLPAAEGTHLGAVFEHAMLPGYQSNYFGYLWAEVFGHEIFRKFEREGLFNPVLGRQYRKLVLAKGQKSFDFFDEFLGRPPDNKAFLQGLGIESK